MTVALLKLFYRAPADAIDEYVCIDKITVSQSLQQFFHSINSIFGMWYLRAPILEDLNQFSTLTPLVTVLLYLEA